MLKNKTLNAKKSIWVTPNQHVSTTLAVLSHTVLQKKLCIDHWEQSACQAALPEWVSRHRARDNHVGMGPGAPGTHAQDRDSESALKARNRTWGPHEFQSRLRALWHDDTVSLGQSLALGKDLENSRKSCSNVRGPPRHRAWAEAQLTQIWTVLAVMSLKECKHHSQNKNSNQTRSFHDCGGTNQPQGHSWLCMMQNKEKDTL